MPYMVKVQTILLALGCLEASLLGILGFRRYLEDHLFVLNLLKNLNLKVNDEPEHGDY